MKSVAHLRKEVKHTRSALIGMLSLKISFRFMKWHWSAVTVLPCLQKIERGIASWEGRQLMEKYFFRILAIFALWYLSYSATRLDRLHHRVETSWANLDGLATTSSSVAL
jgi:hypothetical protein